MTILKLHSYEYDTSYINVETIEEITPMAGNTTLIITKKDSYKVNGNIAGKLARLIANVTDGNVIDCPTGE